MFGARVGAGLAPSPARSSALRARTGPVMALASRARTMPWVGPRRQADRGLGIVDQASGLVFRLAPGERHELPGVLGHALLDGVLAVEHRAGTVGDFHPSLTLDHNGPKDPAVAVDRQVAFDVDQATEVEVAVDGQVAIHVEHALTVSTVVLEASRDVLARGVVVEVVDALGVGGLGRQRRADPGEELGL